MAETEPQYARDLLRYLVEGPEKSNFRYSTSAATDLRRALFRAASVNGKYIGMFFPELATYSQSVVDGGSSVDDLSVKDDEVEVQDAMDTAEPNRKKRKSTEQNWVMSERDANNVDPSHPGRPCVRKFKKGEPTYRCL